MPSTATLAAEAVVVSDFTFSDCDLRNSSDPDEDLDDRENLLWAKAPGWPSFYFGSHGNFFLLDSAPLPDAGSTWRLRW